MAEVTKVADDGEASLDLLFGKPRPRDEGPVLAVDIVPPDPAGRRSLWLEYGARAGAAVRCPYRYRSALPVARNVVGGWDPDPDLVDQPVDDRVSDLLGRSMDPREVAVGRPGSEEVGRAVGHTDQIGRVQWPGERREIGARHGDALDRFRQDIPFFCRKGGSLGEGVIGMTARRQLDGHVGDDI